MTTSATRSVKALAVLAAGAALLSGCASSNSMVPSAQPYSFIRNSPAYAAHFKEVYSPANLERRPSTANDAQVTVAFSNPQGRQFRFDGNNYRVNLGAMDQDMLRFRSGMYPFQVLNANVPELSGAMMFYNIDKTLSLATLGLGPDNRILLPQLVAQAQAGRLGKYTMKFDDKEVLTYWIGNRKRLFAGGPRPTVEVDFSGTPGISKLMVLGRPVPGFYRELYVNKMLGNEGGHHENVAAEYPIEFIAGKRMYGGYLQNLKANEYTAFVKIPCSIPGELLKAADQGTVSRFLVYCGEGDNREAVAEIVFSRR